MTHHHRLLPFHPLLPCFSLFLFEKPLLEHLLTISLTCMFALIPMHGNRAPLPRNDLPKGLSISEVAKCLQWSPPTHQQRPRNFYLDD
ncbi:hypothetical protein FA13DRAFT_174094 [Coprinellus micaceus]|uniref:Uncharacterized protein n=1 Tax=Coprinellus micaceus TaxID=71717 RepID=A0A4Y7SGU8_COPMI|nr:hypothetical protein FA13DRAFT_174094 [Coprinellus micaceus]